MNLQEAVDSLGSTEQEVHDILVAGNYKGDRCVCLSCPVANYLSDKVGVSMNVGIFILPDHSLVPATDWVLTTPPHIVEFTNHFDVGQYPELEL